MENEGNISTEFWWNNAERGKPKYLKYTLMQQVLTQNFSLVEERECVDPEATYCDLCLILKILF
jgi:hypothetical protein